MQKNIQRISVFYEKSPKMKKKSKKIKKKLKMCLQASFFSTEQYIVMYRFKQPMTWRLHEIPEVL